MLIRNMSKCVSMKPESIADLVQCIRNELRLGRGVTPIIRQVFAHSDGSFHIVTSDRSEKSLLLGPGGRVSAVLSRRILAPVTIYGADELVLRKHRLELTLGRIEEMISAATTPARKMILQGLQNLIIQELRFPETNTVFDQSIGHGARVAVAFSGGVDSGASLAILKECGFEPEAISVDMGYTFLNPREMNNMSEWCSHMGVKHIRIPPRENISQIIQRAKEEKVHPCGECHTLILDSILEYAANNNHSVLVTGEMLPGGRQAIVECDNLLIVHLPAALSLSKHRTEQISRIHGRTASQRRFGCRLLAEIHSKGWMNAGPSVYRVLRELEAGVLTTGQALEYIKTIVKRMHDMGGEAEE